jgi:hypothetical protein
MENPKHARYTTESYAYSNAIDAKNIDTLEAGARHLSSV